MLTSNHGGNVTFMQVLNEQANFSDMNTPPPQKNFRPGEEGGPPPPGLKFFLLSITQDDHDDRLQSGVANRTEAFVDSSNTVGASPAVNSLP